MAIHVTDTRRHFGDPGQNEQASEGKKNAGAGDQRGFAKSYIDKIDTTRNSLIHHPSNPQAGGGANDFRGE